MRAGRGGTMRSWRARIVAGVVLALAVGCQAATPVSTAVLDEPSPTTEPTPAEVAPTPDPETDPAIVALARRKIRHIVFLVKENRTFDHLFGRFPGADGATEGMTCDGSVVPLVRARDDAPGAGHSFQAGIVAINGGRMNCFDQVDSGKHLEGYVQFHEDAIPNYWAYARAFTLADRFFSSSYGPTAVEHYWIVASQSDRFVDNERPLDGQGGEEPIGEYCDDPLERAWSFPRLTEEEEAEIFRLEEVPDVKAIHATWVERWPCHDIRILPDLLERRGISWRYYTGPSPYFMVIRGIPHVRYGPMWEKVVSWEEFVPDLEAGDLPSVSWLVPPATLGPPRIRRDVRGENWTVAMNALMSPSGSTPRSSSRGRLGGYYDHVPAVDIYGYGLGSGDRIAGAGPGHLRRRRLLLGPEADRDGVRVPSLTERDANANDLLSAFDFEQRPNAPLVLGERTCPTPDGP
jgi:phospholipase C